MKRFFIALGIFAAVLLIPLSAFASEENEYEEQLKNYDFSFLEELDESTYKLLEELGLSDFDYNTLVDFSFKDFLDKAKDSVSGSFRTPLEAGAAIIVFIILSSFCRICAPPFPTVK